MICHILCPECGEDLAEVYPAYRAIKDAHFKKIIDDPKVGDIYDLETIELKSNVLTEISFIMEALRIVNSCCRVHIMGTHDSNLFWVFILGNS